MHAFERAQAFVFDAFAVHAHDVDLRVVEDPGVVDRLADRDVGVFEFDVLSDQRDLDVQLRLLDPLDDLRPFLELRRMRHLAS